MYVDIRPIPSSNVNWRNRAESDSPHFLIRVASDHFSNILVEREFPARCNLFAVSNSGLIFKDVAVTGFPTSLLK